MARLRDHGAEDHAHQHARTARNIGNLDQATLLLLAEPIGKHVL